MITSSSEPSPENTPAPLLTPPPLPELSFTAEPPFPPYEEVDLENRSQYLVTGGTVVFTVAVVCIGLGLLVYLIKRK